MPKGIPAHKKINGGQNIQFGKSCVSASEITKTKTPVSKMAKPPKVIGSATERLCPAGALIAF
jgi:hypothetical protein